MSMTKAEILEALNTAYNALGYGAGNDPVEITEDNVSLIGALPDSQVQPFFHEFNKLLVERWFTNAINSSAKSLFRFIIRDNGAHGFGIVDRFVNLVNGASYPATAADIAADLVSPADNPVDVKRYTEPYGPGKYKATIMRQQLRKFLSPSGMTEYISQVEANLFNSAEYDMLREVAAMMKRAVEGDNVVVDPTVDMTTEGGLATLCEKMMTAYDAFRQPTASYNVGGRVMSTPDGADVVIVTTPSRWNRLKARLFADRYNLAQIYIDGKVLFAPEGTDLGTYTYEEGGETKTAAVQFIVTDARGFCLDVTTMEILPFVVSNMNYINQFLHVEGVEGAIPTFCNCIAFAGDFGSFIDPDTPTPPSPAETKCVLVKTRSSSDLRVNGEEPSPVEVGATAYIVNIGDTLSTVDITLYIACYDKDGTELLSANTGDTPTITIPDDTFIVTMDR